MLFNSVEFAIFLPIVFILYWCFLNKNLKVQNAFLLVASYLFYGFWDWRFLGLIFFSSVVDFLIGRQLGQETNKNRRKSLLFVSVFVNLGFLAFFKYFNFFAQSFADAFTLFGVPFEASRLDIILPVGISFYTFQTLSYSLDIYNNKLKPTNDFIGFLAFVSFFPQLVAGPIERAANLLPQFYQKRQFDYKAATDGMRQILWGLFKKMVIADNCAVMANEIFANYDQLSGGTLFLGCLYFTIQIYGDFSGYSDIAIGTARLFGFNLLQNFNFPYFATSTTEFWRKWHISMSSWFKDYLNQKLLIYFRSWGTAGILWALFITFGIIGLWHGADWNFIVYGLLHGLMLVIELFSRKRRKKLRKKLPKKVFAIGGWLITMLYWMFSLVFFRAKNIEHALGYLGQLFSSWAIEPIAVLSIPLAFNLVLLFVVEWFQKNKQHGLEFDEALVPKIYRWSIYCLVIFLILAFEGKQQEFVYFQF